MNKKVIYYKDELKDEFSTAQIKPRIIDENYKYIKIPCGIFAVWLCKIL